MQIERRSAERKLLDLYIEELSVDWKSKFDLHIRQLSAERKIICRLKNYLQIQVWSADLRSIRSADGRAICR